MLVEKALFITVSPAAILMAMASPAAAQDAAGEQDMAPTEIIVTAQKRSERINDVGMAITAVTGDSLAAKGITDTADLSRIEPSFTFTKSNYGAPVYSLRGVGFYDTALGATPAVTVYLDQVPVPYSIMSRAVGFDLARVEILKGPQGTLFGQNSTGGAINYIAAKPSDDLETGFDFSFGRFNAIDATAFISGPLSQSLSARLAVHTEQGDAWQKSYTRNDSLGRVDRLYGRLLLDWRPVDGLSVEINVNGGYDKSDTQAGQLIAVPFPALPAGLVNYPRAPQNARAADWDATGDFSRDDHQYQFAATIGYELSDSVQFKSITSYQHYTLDAHSDVDGTAFDSFSTVNTGRINAFSQEIQILGKSSDRFTWIVGGNYAKDKVADNLPSSFPASRFALAGILSLDPRNVQNIETKAVFANAEFALTDTLKVNGGIRYTAQDRHFEGCSYDSGDGTAAAFLQRVFRVTIPAGGCALLDTRFQPVVFESDLDQDNVSWRTGLNWKVARDSLLYATVSKGYKAGAFPTAGVTFTAGLFPAVQESLLAYEAGFKLGLLDRALQLNGSIFYYDYRNKQVRGRITDPTFGNLNRLINIPRSEETGVELSLSARPVSGLTLNGAVTYLDSKIKGPFVNLDALGVNRDLAGQAFPYTPKWTVVGGLQYEHAVSSGWKIFGGADITYRDESFAGLGEVALFRLPASTILDLRAGVESPDGKWRVALWGRNVTNDYSWSNVVSVTGDTVIRYAAMPVTYGLTLSFRH